MNKSFNANKRKIRVISLIVMCIMLLNGIVYDTSLATHTIRIPSTTYNLGIASGNILGSQNEDIRRIKFATRSLLEAIVPGALPATLSDINLRRQLIKSQDLIQQLNLGSLVPCVYGTSRSGDTWLMRWWVADEHSQEPRGYIAEFSRTGPLEVRVYLEPGTGITESTPTERQKDKYVDAWTTIWDAGVPNSMFTKYRGEMKEFWEDSFSEIAELYPDARMLDIATGNLAIPLIAKNVVQFQITAIDTADIKPEYIEDSDGIEFHKRDFKNTGFEKNSFEVVSGCHALEYSGREVSDVKDTLREINRILRDGGEGVFVLHHPGANLVRYSRGLIDFDIMAEKMGLMKHLSKHVETNGRQMLETLLEDKTVLNKINEYYAMNAVNLIEKIMSLVSDGKYKEAKEILEEVVVTNEASVTNAKALIINGFIFEDEEQIRSVFSETGFDVTLLEPLMKNSEEFWGSKLLGWKLRVKKKSRNNALMGALSDISPVDRKPDYFKVDDYLIIDTRNMRAGFGQGIIKAIVRKVHPEDKNIEIERVTEDGVLDGLLASFFVNDKNVWKWDPEMAFIPKGKQLRPVAYLSRTELGEDLRQLLNSHRILTVEELEDISELELKRIVGSDQVDMVKTALKRWAKEEKNGFHRYIKPVTESADGYVSEVPLNETPSYGDEKKREINEPVPATKTVDTPEVTADGFGTAPYILNKIQSFFISDSPWLQDFSKFYESLQLEQKQVLDRQLREGYKLIYFMMEDTLAISDYRSWVLESEFKHIKYALRLIRLEVTSQTPDFDKVTQIINDFVIERYITALWSSGIAEKTERDLSLTEIEESLLIKSVALEDFCPVGCQHCSAPHHNKGTMPFSALKDLINSPKMRFPLTTKVSLTYSEPLTYKSEEKDIVDVAELLLGKGAHVSIVTSGLGVNESRLNNILERLKILQEKYPGKISITLSFNLFSRLKKDKYFSRIQHILETATSLISSIKVTYHNMNKDETVETIKRLVGSKKISTAGQYLTCDGKAIEIFANNPEIKLQEIPFFPDVNENIKPNFSLVELGAGYTLWPDLFISPYCAPIGRPLRSFGNIQRDNVKTIKTNVAEFCRVALNMADGPYLSHYEDVIVKTEMIRRQSFGLPAEKIVTSTSNSLRIIVLRQLCTLYAKVKNIHDIKSSPEVRKRTISALQKEIDEWRTAIKGVGTAHNFSPEVEYIINLAVQEGICTFEELGVLPEEIKKWKELWDDYYSTEMAKEIRSNIKSTSKSIEETEREIDKIFPEIKKAHIDLIKMIPEEGKPRIIVDEEIFAKNEFKKDITGRHFNNRYIAAGDVCNLEKCDTSSVDDILRTLNKTGYPPGRTIVQISNELDAEDMQRLKRDAPKGVRFVRVDTSDLDVLDNYHSDDELRWKLRFSLYGMLLAARNITEDDIHYKETSPVYQMLSFFLKTHGVEDTNSYIKELAEDNIAFLVNYSLSFIPTESWSKNLRYYLTSIEYVAGAA